MKEVIKGLGQALSSVEELKEPVRNISYAAMETEEESVITQPSVEEVEKHQIEQGQKEVKSMESKEESVNTQPSVEEVEKLQIEQGQKQVKRGKKKQKWGPILPLQRSTRSVDDGRTMQDKAQEAKGSGILMTMQVIQQKYHNL